jgi:hypothetical protein
MEKVPVLFFSHLFPVLFSPSKTWRNKQGKGKGRLFFTVFIVSDDLRLDPPSASLNRQTTEIEERLRKREGR